MFPETVQDYLGFCGNCRVEDIRVKRVANRRGSEDGNDHETALT